MPYKLARQIDHEVNMYHGQNPLQTALHVQFKAKSIWIPPQLNRIKLNVGITFINAITPIGIGFILRDHMGKFLGAGTTVEHAGSSEEGECSGLLAAARWASQQHLKNIVLETDNKGAAG
ncbi:Reverse transcriptase zinc-binding domain, partial [Thalictrum thalictroides]